MTPSNGDGLFRHRPPQLFRTSTAPRRRSRVRGPGSAPPGSGRTPRVPPRIRGARHRCARTPRPCPATPVPERSPDTSRGPGMPLEHRPHGRSRERSSRLTQREGQALKARKIREALPETSQRATRTPYSRCRRTGYRFAADRRLSSRCNLGVLCSFSGLVARRRGHTCRQPAATSRTFLTEVG